MKIVAAPFIAILAAACLLPLAAHAENKHYPSTAAE